MQELDAKKDVHRPDHTGPMVRKQLLEVVFEVPILYRTRNGDIHGTLFVNYDEFTFLPDPKKLKQVLLDSKKKKGTARVCCAFFSLFCSAKT